MINGPYGRESHASEAVLRSVPLTAILDELQSRLATLLDGHRVYFTPREAADFLGISERTLFGLTQPRGDIPSIKIGGRLVKYDRRDLIDYMDRAKQGGPADE